MKKAGLNGYVYDFNAIAVDDILNIHKYLMKMDSIKCLDLLKQCLF